ncbi:MAG: hypothetical protein IJM83_11535 [Firmicutes bacterium]|nr:hypothetical protein [Bacillota bacterium]
MKLWMYGSTDKDQPDVVTGARQLKKIGFSTIVGGVESAKAGIEEGMDAYVSSGAYRGPDFKGEEWLAEDPWGNKRRWFSSTCPTRKEVREYNLSQIRNLAKTPGIKGVIIDGTRFSSPSSGPEPDGTDAYFTCFCPSCMAKARAMGFDPAEMREAAARLFDYLHGKPVKIEWYLHGLHEWMEFRRAATTQHLVNFAKTVKEVDPDLETGIFIFTPALSDLVGQNYRDLRPYMNIYSPMIYRCYPEESGPSCLNVELSDMLKMLEGATDLDIHDRIRILSGLTGIELTGYEDPDVMRKGLDVRLIREETNRARTMIGDRKLVPIIELDDPDLEEAICEARKGGADEVSFFVYNRMILEKQAGMLERLAAK